MLYFFVYSILNCLETATVFYILAHSICVQRIPPLDALLLWSVSVSVGVRVIKMEKVTSYAVS